MPEIVGVYGCNELSTRMRNSMIASRDETPIGLLQKPDSAIHVREALDDRRGLVGGAVIDNQDLQIGVGLVADRGNGPLDGRRGIVSGNDDRHPSRKFVGASGFPRTRVMVSS